MGQSDELADEILSELLRLWPLLEQSRQQELLGLARTIADGPASTEAGEAKGPGGKQ